jgi:ADP-heptose:LPS heptosyltransferase
VASQTDIIDRLPLNSRVAVIRLRSLGDCVLCTPGLHLLKQARPDVKLAIIVEERFAGVFEGNPDIAEILPPSARAVRAFAPDLCLNLHGGGRSARLTALSGAATRAGFDIFRPSWIYNAPIPTAQETLGVTRRVHTAEHAASAMFHLGVPLSEVPRAWLYAPDGSSSFAPAKPYAVIHPFAATREKTWPAQSFLELTRRLEFETVVVGSAADDFGPFESLKSAPGLPLSELKRLMRDASLFIGNDSGPAHVAAAFRVPEVVFFGPSDAEIWSPWRTPNIVLRTAGPIAGISVSSAIGAVETLRSRDRVAIP